MISFKKIAKQIGAVGGFVGVAGIIAAMFQHGAPPEAFFFLSLFLGLGGTSAYSLQQDAKREQAFANLQQTRELLQIAASNYGKVSLSELVMKVDMPLPELKAKLDEMQKDGLLGMEVSNTGEVLYTVSNPLTLEDRLDSHKLIN